MNVSKAAAKMPPLAPGEFRFTTKAISIEPPSEDGRRRFKMVASSTVIDEGKDEIKMSALEDLRAAYAQGRNVFTDHEHKVDNVFGRTDTAVIMASGEKDPKTGAPIYDLHVSGGVNEPNPRMIQLADSIDGGYVTFGASIGARIKESKRNKDGGMDIYRLDGKEVSLVGIPMNQRSWTYKSSLIDRAVKAAEKTGEEFFDEDGDEDEETEKSDLVAAPTVEEEAVKALDTASGSALQVQGLCTKCAHQTDCNCTDCDCDSTLHKAMTADDLTVKAEITDEAPLSDQLSGATIQPVNADVQESESEAVETAPAETPETPETPAAAEDDETAAPDAEKALSFEATDVTALAQKAVRLAAALDERNHEIETLTAEKATLTSEIEEAKAVITKLMAMPNRPKTQAVVVSDLAKRLPSVIAPEVREFLAKSAGDTHEH